MRMHFEAMCAKSPAKELIACIWKLRGKLVQKGRKVGCRARRWTWKDVEGREKTTWNSHGFKDVASCTALYILHPLRRYGRSSRPRVKGVPSISSLFCEASPKLSATWESEIFQGSWIQTSISTWSTQGGLQRLTLCRPKAPAQQIDAPHAEKSLTVDAGKGRNPEPGSRTSTRIVIIDAGRDIHGCLLLIMVGNRARHPPPAPSERSGIILVERGCSGRVSWVQIFISAAGVSFISVSRARRKTETGTSQGRTTLHECASAHMARVGCVDEGAWWCFEVLRRGGGAAEMDEGGFQLTERSTSGTPYGPGLKGTDITPGRSGVGAETSRKKRGRLLARRRPSSARALRPCAWPRPRAWRGAGGYSAAAGAEVRALVGSVGAAGRTGRYDGRYTASSRSGKRRASEGPPAGERAGGRKGSSGAASQPRILQELLKRRICEQILRGTWAEKERRGMWILGLNPVTCPGNTDKQRVFNPAEFQLHQLAIPYMYSRGRRKLSGVVHAARRLPFRPRLRLNSSRIHQKLCTCVRVDGCVRKLMKEPGLGCREYWFKLNPDSKAVEVDPPLPMRVQS
ncbi:hypothetical protein B0H17DRAFT_1280603, partial [Mycena rosella]